MGLVRQPLISSTSSLLSGPFSLWIRSVLDTIQCGTGNEIYTTLVAECSKVPTAIPATAVCDQEFWYFMFSKNWLEVIDYSGKCCRVQLPYYGVICCNSLRLKVTVRHDSQTNHLQVFCHGKRGPLWGCSSSFGCCLENSIQVGHLVVSSFIMVEHL